MEELISKAGERYRDGISAVMAFVIIVNIMEEVPQTFRNINYSQWKSFMQHQKVSIHLLIRLGLVNRKVNVYEGIGGILEWKQVLQSRYESRFNDNDDRGATERVGRGEEVGGEGEERREGGRGEGGDGGDNGEVRVSRMEKQLQEPRQQTARDGSLSYEEALFRRLLDADDEREGNLLLEIISSETSSSTTSRRSKAEEQQDHRRPGEREQQQQQQQYRQQQQRQQQQHLRTEKRKIRNDVVGTTTETSSSSLSTKRSKLMLLPPPPPSS